MSGFVIAVVVTLFLALLSANAVQQLRTGQWSTWTSSRMNPGIVRVSGAFTLAICAFFAITLWWMAIARH